MSVSPLGTDIVVAHFNTPGVAGYPWSSGFGTKYANPATVNGTNKSGCAFSPLF